LKLATLFKDLETSRSKVSLTRPKLSMGGVLSALRGLVVPSSDQINPSSIATVHYLRSIFWV
jgi:hypothetical protein